jgi:hypothetical protein
MTNVVRISKSLAFSFLLFISPQLFADCGEFLLGTSPLNPQFYQQALAQERPGPAALPEEILAFHARLSGHPELLKLIQEVNIERIRFGSHFRVTGGRLRARVLVVKHFNWETRDRDLALLAMALFQERQKQLRFELRPSRYIAELQGYGQRLESLVLPEWRAKRSGWFGFALKSLIGMNPNGWKMPKSKSVFAIQFALTRASMAFYAYLTISTAAHLPQAYQTASMLIHLSGAFTEISNQLENGIEFDGRAERLKLIGRYQAQIESVEKDLLAADPSDMNQLREKIERYERIIKSLQDDLKQS